MRTRRVQSELGEWYVEMQPKPFTKWERVAGPCKTERLCKQRETRYMRKHEKAQAADLVTRVMSKSWKEMVI